MRDSLILLLTAFCASAVAWLFWHFTGKNGFDLLAILVMATLFAENLQLKRRLKKYQHLGLDAPGDQAREG
jgi:hypothetical protein